MGWGVSGRGGVGEGGGGGAGGGVEGGRAGGDTGGWSAEDEERAYLAELAHLRPYAPAAHKLYLELTQVMNISNKYSHVK